MAVEGYGFTGSAAKSLYEPMLATAGFMNVANGGFGVAERYGVQPEYSAKAPAPKGPTPSI